MLFHLTRLFILLLQNIVHNLCSRHLEMYESWSECAIREVMEETGIILESDNIVFGHVTNDVMEEEKKHYITIFMMGRCSNDSDKPKTLEPDKCEGWESYSWDDLQNILTESKPRCEKPLRM